jgi:hypothetical protein
MANLKSLNIDGDLILDKGTASVSGSTITIALDTGNFFEIDLQNASGNIGTFTFTNYTLIPDARAEFTLHITQGSPARSISWGGMTGTFHFAPPGAPILTSTNNAIDILRFTSASNSAGLWYGEVVGLNFT